MNAIKTVIFALGLAFAPAAVAQVPAVAPPATIAVPTADSKPAAAVPAAPKVADIARTAPDPTIGQPVPGGYEIQQQVTPIGKRAIWMHNALLMPIITVISIFVLVLLFWASYRYRRKGNPIPSKVSHNALIEVIWTLTPVLILLIIVFPSISLLAAQYKPVGKEALTIKAIGNQWYWTYEYPDNGGFEVVSNMLPDAQAKANGEPRLLAVDNRVVVPVGTPIRLLTTSNDVIHAWYVPAFWTQMDAVPGRINEASFTVDRIGVYYGQCNNICGARHAFMPITVQAVSPADFAQWVAAHGGVPKGAKPAAAAAPATTAALTTTPAPAAAPATKG
ncbi:MAG: coxB [Sphingomonadales bacterium]|nr:coxB [Sphingomonadales bacterium]